MTAEIFDEKSGNWSDGPGTFHRGSLSDEKWSRSCDSNWLSGETGALPSECQERLELESKTRYWPARMEELLPGVYLDGAHNAGGDRSSGADDGTVSAGRKRTGSICCFQPYQIKIIRP